MQAFQHNFPAAYSQEIVDNFVDLHTAVCSATVSDLDNRIQIETGQLWGCKVESDNNSPDV